MTTQNTPQALSLRVWWVPQIPGKPFHHPVQNFVQAKAFLDLLAQYDSFLLENNHRVDHANAGGLEEFCPEENEWHEWSNEHGEVIDDLEFT